MDLEKKKFLKAKNLHLSGKYREAQKIYINLLKQNNNNFLLHNLIGTTYLQLGYYDEAINYFNKSIQLNSEFAENFNNIGIAYAEKKEFTQALKYYEKAIKLKKDFFSAHLNKGISLKNLKKFDLAIKSLEICIKINPNNAQIYLNLGNIFVNLKKYKDAKILFDKAIKLNKNYGEAYSNRGELLQLHLKQTGLAIKDYEKALIYKDKLKYVYGKLIHAKMLINDWDTYEENMKYLKHGIEKNDQIILPFPLLSLIDEPRLQKKVAENFANEFPYIKKKKKIGIIKKNEKIKIGYFSARFYDCATLHNMHDVFKYHDKEKFEIYAFNYGKEDYWTQKIKKYFTNFYNISDLPLKDIKNLSKKINLQIAINLTGYTLNARDEIFYNHVAPIQINFLGYPGTLGSRIYDYIIADETVIPYNLEKFYSEKILRLQNCYLPTQSNQKVSTKKFNKNNLGIPENKFVFACFNNSYKITPEIFRCWMKILNKNNESILWLLKSNSLSEKNILREASKLGIKENRIFFADRISVDEHIKRMEIIDLFLDTYPYNAHTTAREAILMNIPILTFMGKSFASRVAGSILKTIGLEGLIVKNLDDYVKEAVRLSVDRDEVIKIKNHLKDKINLKKLFDSNEYTKDLERKYLEIINLQTFERK